MSDPTSTAKTARESLARGLSALQSDPNVPAQLLELAAPIAQGMGALHQIERSQGAQIQPHAEVALTNVRSALQQLQAAPQTHPAVAAAMEAVAASLGLVHALTKMQATAPAPQAQEQKQAQQQQQPARQALPAQGSPPPQQQAAPQAAAFPPPRQDPFQPAAQAPRQQQQQQAQPQPQQAQRQQPQQAALQGAAPPVDGAPVVSADLGAHSPTNFYKGLSGNDIIDHGGLFVSTYMIPKIGAPVRLKISLPGG